jgi:hypothetical protein
MQVSKQDLIRAQFLAFLGLRLFDFDDHIDGGEDLISRVGELRSRRFEVVIGNAGADTGALFDPHGVAAMDQFPNACGHKADAVFVSFDFLGNANFHHILPLRVSARL